MAKANIFIVEDESIVALDLKYSLENLGYTVCGLASSAEEAVKRILEVKPQLVLMDIGLDGPADGITAAAEIKSKLDVPLIYLTANSDEGTFNRAKVTGPFGYVLKPFDERDLQTTIEMALYKYEAESRLKANERWFSTTLKSIGDAVITTDLKGNVTFMNEVAEKLTGYTISEASGRALEEVFHIFNENTHENMEHPVAKVIRDGATVGLANHTVLRSKDGSEAPIDDSAAPIRDDKGAITGVVLVFRDIKERKAAEKKLRQSEENARNIIELSPYAILVHKNGISLYCNSAAVEMIGAKSRDEVVGQPVWKFLHPDFHRLALERIKYMLETGQNVPLSEEKIVRFDGRVLDVEIAAGYFLYEGQPAIQTVIRDITERKAHREEIRKSEMLFRLVWENSADGMRLTDKFGNVKLVNESFCRMAGLSRSQMEGKSISIIYRDEFRGETISDFIRNFKEGTIIPHSQQKARLWNGKDRWFDIAHSEMNLPGQEPMLLSVFRDITERKKSEERLSKLNECMLSFGADAKENINRLVALCGEQLSAAGAIYNRLEDDMLYSLGQWNLPEGYCEKDRAEGHICYDVIRGDKNKTWIIPNLEETNYADTDANVNRYGLKTYIGKQVACDNKPVGSLCMVYKDDYNPSQDDLELLGIAVAAIGVEEKRKHAEDELILAKEEAEKADRLKSDFLAQMSHEIRTPINTILSFTSLLKAELENKLPEDMASVFKIIDSGGRRLTRTIDMILSMSQLQSGSYEMNPRKLNLKSDILDSLFKEFENQAKLKELEFSLSGESSEDEVITGDPYSLTQLFQNLIDNAIKYTRKGKVEILISNGKPDKTSVTIRDTGIGISEEYIPKLFSPFSQEETGYTRRFEGNGLGLALVKKYADLNGASIKVESTKGVGTQVCVTLNKENEL
ncbi:MAG TPA: PAS domain S-box protein [Ignavibacteriales bacterium]|nr:PAS domain S-box protein [Ignavibacteriales bacterium]